MNAIQEAVFIHVSEEVERAPAMQDAWQIFRETYRAAEAVLKPAGHGALCLDLEAAVNAVVSEAVRAAFFQGLAFDAKALLLAAREE